MEFFRHCRDPKFFQKRIIQFGVFHYGFIGDRVHNAVAYFLDVNDVPKMIRGFEKGSWDGVRGRRIESKIDDMVEGLAQNGGVPVRCVQLQGQRGRVL